MTLILFYFVLEISENQAPKSTSTPVLEELLSYYVRYFIFDVFVGVFI